MASLRGLAVYAAQNQILGDALIVNVGGVQRCMVAEMAPNILSGGRPVPQIRFICDGFCGLVPHRPSKQCREVDRAAISQGAAVPAPPGLVRDTGARVPTPYRAGQPVAAGGGGLRLVR
jgi:hypothetical protein